MSARRITGDVRGTSVRELLEHVDALEEELRRAYTTNVDELDADLRRAFARYAGHEPTCDRDARTATACPCGFAQVRAMCGGQLGPTGTPERPDGRGVRTAPPGPYKAPVRGCNHADALCSCASSPPCGFCSWAYGLGRPVGLAVNRACPEHGANRVQGPRDPFQP